GCAYGYFGPYFDNGKPIEQNWANRLDSENLSGLTAYQSEYKPKANRYTVGESGSFIYIQMQTAALKEILKIDSEKFQAYCRSVTEKTLNKLCC
ncbi:MAG: aminotransferase, partial [Winogradskyella sp.]|nr:aminotransferase [Winogradskyella sp.]